MVFHPLSLVYTKLYLHPREKKDQRIGRKVASIAVLAEEEIDE